MRRRSRTWHLGAALMVAALLLAGCQQREPKVATPPPPEVTVAQPVQRGVTYYADYTGNSRASESVEVRARVQGILEKVNFQPSSLVNKGQLLFVIEPKPFQAKVDEAKAQLAVAKAQLKLAQATLTRKENAYKDRAVSEVEVIQARAERDQAQAGIQAAEAQVEVVQIDLGYTQIHAPIKGRVSRSLVDAGNLVGRNEATLLTTIVNDDPIYVYFNISEQDLLAVRQYASHGKTFEDEFGHRLVYLSLANQKNYPYQGYLDYIDNTVDPHTGTIQVRGRFNNPNGDILPGLFVRVRIPVVKMDKALLVSQDALSADQGGRYLLLVSEKNQVEYRRVEVGPSEGSMIVISKGLKPGEWVIVQGLQRVRAGMKVRPVKQEAKPAAQAQPAPSGQPARAAAPGQDPKPAAPAGPEPTSPQAQ